MAWPRNLRARLLSWKAFAVLTLFGLISAIFSNVYLHSLDSVQEPDFHEELFHSPDVFKVNYAEMERNFMVYLNEEGNPFEKIPQRHEEKYQKEIFFWNSIRNTHFGFRHLYVKPHMHFIPYPLLIWGDLGKEENETAEEDNEDNKRLHYSYHWNRTLGADHFYMSCDDGITFPAKFGRFLAKNSIRAVCSASYNDSEYYPHKDFTIPYIMQEFASPPGGIDSKNRRTKLFFWVGNPKSNLPEELRSKWENDEEVEIHGSSNEHISTSEDLYSMQFYSAKYCICPGDNDVYDIYIALAIHLGCVPVISSDYYALPFNDILDWTEFSVILVEADVDHLKEILKAIPISKYKKLQSNVVKAQRHFRWNRKPKNYDAFHLTMYELWLRRHATHY